MTDSIPQLTPWLIFHHDLSENNLKAVKNQACIALATIKLDMSEGISQSVNRPENFKSL